MDVGDLVGGKYRLTHRLGAGAMGVVWAAVNGRTGRKVALKLILHPTDDLRDRLLREARACGKLEHRNIVEIYDVGETESGDPFLVMQLLTGETLSEVLSRRRRIRPRPAARIGRDIAGALAAAHEAMIVHRDLKPANIFLHREGGAGEEAFALKVLDFGVSKNLATGDGRVTATGMMVGSPAYMSPEQIQRAKDVDHRTDIWSLGIILFEMLTGARPFQGTAEEIVAQVLGAPIPPLSSRVRHAPKELDTIVARCLARDREERYHDTKDLARRLAEYAEMDQPSRILVGIPAADEATTLPLKRRPDPQDPMILPTGTHLLSPADPIPSPMPVWRMEMRQALAASRQTAVTQRSAVIEEALGGATAIIPSEPNATKVSPAAVDPAVATAPLADLLPPRGPIDPAPREVPARAPPRRATWIYPALGVIALVLGGLVALGMMRNHPSAPPPVTETPHLSGPEHAPLPPPDPPPVPAATMEPIAAEVAPAVAPKAPPVSSSKPRSPSSSGLNAARSLPPCGRFIKPPCRQ